MEGDDDFFSFIRQVKELVTSNRPLRLRLDLPSGVNDDMLLPQRVVGSESICGGIEYRVLCVSSQVRIPLKKLIAVPAALDIVTDRGKLRSICGIITEAASGDSDGGLASYQLVLRDALSILEKRTNTRVFLRTTEVEVVKSLLSEWGQRSLMLGTGFRVETDPVFDLREYPQREFIMQHNESDAAFIRRLLKRRGIGWYIRSKQNADYPCHSLVLFNDVVSLNQNAAGTIRYHRDNATEQRDTITSWSAVRSLQPGSVSRHSWDYRNPLGTGFMSAQTGTTNDQGPHGNELAASLDDYLVMPPHVGRDNEDLLNFGKLRMSRHDYESKCFHGEGSVRDLCAGEYFTLSGHPEIDYHPKEERDFVVTALQLTAHNNLPKSLATRVERLFARNRWMQDGSEQWQRDLAEQVASGPMRVHIQFTAVRLGIPIVPAYDPRVDVPQVQMQSAIVVGPDSGEVHCDEMGRVKIRFPATRDEDHVAACGNGASDTEMDSAWVRVASNWAGNGAGSMDQCGTLGLPRIGSEVLVAFLGGDPDKPVIVGQLYNGQARPIALSSAGGLPGNKYLSGIKSRENKGERANQLRFDDTNGQISAQLASDHGDSQLNLGFLTQPRADGVGEPRGNGAELRSDGSVAVRGAKGLLLTAWQRSASSDKQLARDELLGLLTQCGTVAQSLGDYAEAHQALPTDTSELDNLSGVVEAWDSDAQQTDDEAPRSASVAITAPGGISFAVPQVAVSYAGTNLENYAGQHQHFGAGGSVVFNSGKGMSFFAKEGGFRAIAHHGQLLLQSQHGETVVNAAKDIKLTAGDGKLVAMAKEIVLIAEDGSFIKIGGGITIATSGTATHHGASFKFEGGATMSTAFPQFSESNSEKKPQLTVELVDADGNSPEGEPFVLRPHSGGEERSGTLDGGSAVIDDMPPGSFSLSQPSRRS